VLAVGLVKGDSSLVWHKRNTVRVRNAYNPECTKIIKYFIDYTFKKYLRQIF